MRPWTQPTNTGNWNEYANAAAYASRARAQLNQHAVLMAEAILSMDPVLLSTARGIIERIGHTEATGT